ncbi:MAG: DNA primase [Chitinophagaceae bacterium]
MITQTTIQQIQARIDVVDVVGNFVKLKKRGSSYLGLCPFHNERTPSFTVSPSKEIYKCFGCGKSGNSISFIMEHEKLGYAEALRWLANRYNIDVEETAVSSEVMQLQQAAESLHIINQFAQKFYQELLLQTDEGRRAGLAYLLERGFTETTIAKFGLGYAPPQGNLLSQAAIKNQYNPELLQRSGLVVNRNELLVDNYRDRIIFPIHNNTGKILGFGARLIKSNDKAPKYINTPENELYVKSKILYGSYFARQAIDKQNECLLVEGYTDVLSLHQGGIENVVASGGTSLTGDQLRLVKKYSKNLTIIYDGDAAGVKAALRGLDMALEEGLNVKLVLIPDKEDPDSYLRKVGALAFRQFIEKNKKDFILFQIEVSIKDALNDAAKKSEVVNQVAETISKIDRTEDFSKQQDYIRQCSQILKIDETGFTSLVNKFIRNRLSNVEKKLPFEEAAYFEEKAKEGEKANFDDGSFSLLYRDALQEQEIARVLLEHGMKGWHNESRVADYILSELPEEELFQSEAVIKFINAYRELLETAEQVDKNFFLYHPDPILSTLTVSLSYFPYEQSPRWRESENQSTGYQKSLFEQDYKTFISVLHADNKEQLGNFLQSQKDNTEEQIESAVSYLKLRKIKKLLLQNQGDMEGAEPSTLSTFILTHQHLKKMEIELTKKIGAVVIK